MVDKGADQKGATRAAIAQLRRSRWLLAAALVAVLGVYGFGGLSIFVPLLALALLVAAAMLPTAAERQSAGGTAAVEVGGLQRLSGEYLAAAVADPLIIFDRTATIVHANAAAFAAFGGLAPGMSLSLKFRAPEMQALLDGIVSGTMASDVVDYTEKLPVERTYRVSASSVGHGTDLYVLVFKDQSEARRIERMRADFIANASHELRTPLASIAGFIETLRGPARNDAAARDQFLQIMQNQTGRMARLIDDLLSLSRLEMKPYLRPGTEVDLRQTIDSVIDSLAPLANENGIAIERDFIDGPISVPGDRDELFQVFENLLENACKYGQSGGRVTVSIAHAEDGHDPGIDVTIRDYGPGIAEEHIPRITERFYRVDVENSRTQKGTGLGLSIVKHILTRHNARLSIKSEVGKGAAFTVHLPAQ
ncbi:two-component sensor histidine kinase [Mesorhizobium sp. M1A.F.Ca.IN.020.06.1.1]|uniref:ATP-binding protein n=2 Tax=Mesorhizobium TaxID=68287 RepID=UPI000BAFCA42|nr:MULTISPECIES: ATP-binding protein [unclassified Mesorhizobium]PBB29521.1 two-component sensor histidine kinase [Mesorhizobium sp. WSM3882]RUV06846.1 two-component sensor histidine kinase [Mesorhizobium sp. M1A.F.Ca.IN.020.03.2.1]RUV86428.1 two-component sensor histidine kinase [Mesorhizobium sp. M1A.F.Ca.IN.020.32.1.1]RUW11250.1 two-component sensor histidine kinase [Mesorhizobium sp. M1A.F.Ca.IN.022.05.2.1]RUW28388.1 two-component sensor histidine kinase [Mesorhizobium sp. M1A.F.Ca.IN.020.